MAHVPAHVLDSAAECGNRIQSDAGTVTAFFITIHVGCLHTGHYGDIIVVSEGSAGAESRTVAIALDQTQPGSLLVSVHHEIEKCVGVIERREVRLDVTSNRGGRSLSGKIGCGTGKNAHSHQKNNDAEANIRRSQGSSSKQKLKWNDLLLHHGSKGTLQREQFLVPKRNPQIICSLETFVLIVFSALVIAPRSHVAGSIVADAAAISSTPAYCSWC